MKRHDAKRKSTARLDELLSQIAKIEADIRHETNPLDKDSQERSVQRERARRGTRRVAFHPAGALVHQLLITRSVAIWGSTKTHRMKPEQCTSLWGMLVMPFRGSRCEYISTRWAA